MEDWTQSIKSRLNEWDRQAELAAGMQLHRAEVIDKKGYPFFVELGESAETGVRDIKGDRTDFAGIEFSWISPLRFKVANPSYPSLTVEAELLPGEGIKFTNSVISLPSSRPDATSRTYMFEIEGRDNRVFLTDGRRILRKDELLRLILDPVFIRISAAQRNSETTYTSLRQNLADVLDQLVDQQQTVIILRHGSRDVGLMPAGELAGLIETAHLHRSPRKEPRQPAKVHRADRAKTKPASLAEPRREMLRESRQ